MRSAPGRANGGARQAAPVRPRRRPRTRQRRLLPSAIVTARGRHSPGLTRARCSRRSGSTFFERHGRDPGVSSTVHKFTCEPRALLASDKHLRSAERSEAIMKNVKHASECPRHCGGFTCYAIAADPTEYLRSTEKS